MTEGTSSICGFDIGSDDCYIAAARQGGIEMVLNDYSQRSTPSYVLLGGKQRELGVSAKQKQLMNLNNTFNALSRLVGRQYAEVVHHENVPFPIELAPNGEVAVRVEISNDEWVFTATQLLAMLFTKLRQISNFPVDCVINCPHYFTDGQRRALRDAAAISGLNPLRILPDLTAIGVNYCFYRLSSANNKEENLIVAFVDCGHQSTQCGVVLFNTKNNSMQMLSAEHESNLGGRHFNEAIVDYFIREKNLKLGKRGYLRLTGECEKLKKQMSANNNDLPLNVECLQDDRDFSGRMSRTIFEEITADYLTAIENIFKRAYENASNHYAALQKNKDSSLNANFSVSAVEIVGGTSRVPAIKRRIRSVFGVEASTTLNADEAVSRGCALECAILSPSFKVAKELQIMDIAPYQINCRYWHGNEAEGKIYSVNPLFSRGDTIPFTRQIIITAHSLPIMIEMEYINAENKPTAIGQFKITSLENIQINSNKMKIRIRLDNDGLVKVTSAAIQIDEKNDKANDITENEVTPNENDVNSAMETDEGKTNDNGSDPSEGNADKKVKKDTPKPSKPKATSIEMVIEDLWIRGKLSDDDLTQCKEIEANLVLSDKNWKEKMDARNELEEYVYDWRAKLDEGRYDNFITRQDKESFLHDLGKMEQWLYADEESGDIQSRAVYVEKIEDLKKRYSNDFVFRDRECNTRDGSIERLGKAIQMGHKLLENKEVDEEKLKKLETTLTEKQKWFEKTHSVLSSMCLTKNPTITNVQILEQVDAIESQTRKIMEDIHRKRQDEERKKKEEERKKLEEEKKLKDKLEEKTDEMDVDQCKQEQSESQTEQASC